MFPARYAHIEGLSGLSVHSVRAHGRLRVFGRALAHVHVHV